MYERCFCFLILHLSNFQRSLGKPSKRLRTCVSRARPVFCRCSATNSLNTMKLYRRSNSLSNDLPIDADIPSGDYYQVFPRLSYTYHGVQYATIRHNNHQEPPKHSSWTSGSTPFPICICTITAVTCDLRQFGGPRKAESRPMIKPSAVTL